MRVLIFSNMYPTKDHPQFGIYVYNQVKVLEKMGYECKVVSLKSKGNKYFRYLGFFLRGLYHSLLNGKTYPLVHAHYAFPPGAFAMLHKKRYHSKMILTSHGSDINKMPAMSLTVDRWIRRILEYSDFILCVSEHLRFKIKNRYGLSEDKIQVVNMGVNTDIFRKENKSLTRNQLCLPLEGRIILFVGNFYAAKGVLDVIEAFQRASIPQKQLILIGDKNVEVKTRHVVNNIHEKNICILDPQPQTTISTYMNAADVFVLPSYSEGFNLVTLEAMATETLVVTSDIEAFDYLQKDTVIKVPVGNVESLKEGLEKAIRLQGLDKESVIEAQESSKAETYIKNALKVAKDNSHVEKAKQVSKMYRLAKS